jgi:hypothetical protein
MNRRKTCQTEKGASLFTSETAKLATQKKEEMKEERREKTEAEYGGKPLTVLQKEDLAIIWNRCRVRARLRNGIHSGMNLYVISSTCNNSLLVR